MTHNLTINDKKLYPYQDISYFKNLNTLRFFAAFLVILQHGESMKLKNKLPYLGEISLFQNGTNAVTFFFILSGFLITYLLLKERKKKSNIQIRRFYLNRVLRIFPLYFLVVLIGTLLVPFVISFWDIDYDMPYTFDQVWYYYLLFLPCLVTFFYGHHLLEPLWSIGVEVAFYTLWTPLFKLIKKNILILLLSVLLLKIVLLAISFLAPTPTIYRLLIDTYSFDSMAIGGLGAYFIFNSAKDINSNILFKRQFACPIVVLLILFLLFNRNIDNAIWNLFFKTPILSSFILQFMFLYLIITFSLNKNRFMKYENKFLWYLGEISYGIYMYHTMVISIVVLIIKKISFVSHPLIVNILFYILVISGTILIAHLSKKYFENYFIRLRKH